MSAEATEKMHLGVFLMPTGHHVASWRHPQADADAGVNFEHCVKMAQLAERAKFDMLFLQDSLAVRSAHPEALRRSAQYIANFEPLTLLGGLAACTSHIGLVATSSTSYSEPYQLARSFASLDHISHGRAGWNIVTTSLQAAAWNFGRDEHFSHTERYQRAQEFTRVVKGLWDSWDDDAFPRDKTSGHFLDPEKMHALNHKGTFFSVKGPLNLPRPPQGYPVLVQAGVSDDAQAFAAEFAEIIFSSHITIEASRTYRVAAQSRATEFGRRPSDIKVMPGLNPIVGRTEAEADEKVEFLNSLIEPIVALEILSTFLGGIDLSEYALDEKFPDIKPTERSTGSFQGWIDLAKREHLTLRQMAYRAARGRMGVLKGSPTQVADYMEEWFKAGACDGFNIMPSYSPGAFSDFVELVIPELQRRGLFRTEYEGHTFRENLGLSRPKSRYT